MAFLGGVAVPVPSLLPELPVPVPFGVGVPGVDVVGAVGVQMGRHERGLQVLPGPSNLSTGCVRCLAACLLGVDGPSVGGWKPTVGTAVHSWLEEMVVGWGGVEPGRWRAEERVPVCELPWGGGREWVWGSCDVFDVWGGQVIDWKTASGGRLSRFRSGGVPGSYVRQTLLYGWGWSLLGFGVSSVRVVVLPRDGELGDVVDVVFPFDVGVAGALVGRVVGFAEDLVVWGGRDVSVFESEVGCFGCLRRSRGGGFSW